MRYTWSLKRGLKRRKSLKTGFGGLRELTGRGSGLYSFETVSPQRSGGRGEDQSQRQVTTGDTGKTRTGQQKAKVKIKSNSPLSTQRPQ